MKNKGEKQTHVWNTGSQVSGRGNGCKLWTMQRLMTWMSWFSLKQLRKLVLIFFMTCSKIYQAFSNICQYDHQFKDNLPDRGCVPDKCDWIFCDLKESIFEVINYAQNIPSCFTFLWRINNPPYPKRKKLAPSVAERIIPLHLEPYFQRKLCIYNSELHMQGSRISWI